MERCHTGCNQKCRHRGRRADANRCRGRLCGAAGATLYRMRHLLHLGNEGGDGRAIRGQRRAPWQTVDQPHRQRTFQRGDAAANRRMVYTQLTRRGRKGPGAGQHSKMSEILPVEHW